MSYFLKTLIKSKNMFLVKPEVFWKNLQVTQAIEKPVPKTLPKWRTISTVL
jgi:hypothetical protein